MRRKQQPTVRQECMIGWAQSDGPAPLGRNIRRGRRDCRSRVLWAVVLCPLLRTSPLGRQFVYRTTSVQLTEATAHKILRWANPWTILPCRNFELDHADLCLVQTPTRQHPLANCKAVGCTRSFAPCERSSHVRAGQSESTTKARIQTHN